MEKLDGVSTIRIIKNALSLLHPSIIEHGEWVGYALYKMLGWTGKYTKEQLGYFYLLGLFHDCGAYKTDDFENLLEFDCKKVWSHSVYGYFYLKYLSPMSEYADVILYHHLDYRRFGDIPYAFKEVAMCIAVVDRVDVMLRKNSFVFCPEDLEPYRNKKLWGEGIDLFLDSECMFDLVGKDRSRDYREESDAIVRDMNLSQEFCRDMLKFLAYMLDFRSGDTAVRTINANILSVGICKYMGLGAEAEDRLYYASLLYDLGMLSVSRDILGAPRALTALETKRMQQHVEVMEKILSGNISRDIVTVASRHHERLNGSGYPRGLRDHEIDMLSRVLAVTDVTVALSTRHSYREMLGKSEIVKILSGEADKGTLCREVVNTVIQNYDMLLTGAEGTQKKVLANYWRIKQEFDIIMKRFEKYNN